MVKLDLSKLDHVIEKALEEDIGSGDITTEVVLPEARYAEARIISRESGILSGMDIAERVFNKVDPTLKMERFLIDGDALETGTVICELKGNGKSILKGERTALNFLAQCSGIATLTSRFVEAVSGTAAKILDTRKTTPLLREMEKYSVRIGGGYNHRFGLYDMILIKENHIKWVGDLDEALSNCINEIGGTRKFVRVEVEVKDLDELKKVLKYRIDRIMMDNMDVEDVKRGIEMVRRRAEVEISGGITLKNVRDYAETGADYISVGALTHSSRFLDLTLIFR